MSADYLREEIMKLYDIPEDLREKWRQLDVGRCPYCGSLMADGRDHGRSYEDGPIECVPGAAQASRYTIEDAVRNIYDGLRYPYSLYFNRLPPPAPLPKACYTSEYGFRVHVRGACECRR